MKRYIRSNYSRGFVSKDDTDNEIIKVRDELDKDGIAHTFYKEVADMYEANRNPYNNYKVVRNGNEYTITKTNSKSKVTSSRYISAYSEPSAVEYGRFIAEGMRNLNNRFQPFKISNTYMTRTTVNSDGYRITLDVGPRYDEYGPREDFAYEEWILHRDSTSRDYELYGPFEPGEIKDLVTLFRNKPLKEHVKGLDSAMTYLFENVDIPEHAML